jgi:hypothetical protein
MKLLQKSSKTGQGEPSSPVGAEELFRGSLRLYAERDHEKNMAGEKNK